jgi:methylmalonyl-CoA mutase C-terminal domain/subunit
MNRKDKLGEYENLAFCTKKLYSNAIVERNTNSFGFRGVDRHISLVVRHSRRCRWKSQFVRLPTYREDAPMNARKVRILMARLGEGFETSTMKLARAFSEAGYEVIYTDIQEPQAIVASAIQESVDHIGITILPGADIEHFVRIMDLLKHADASHIHITAGGFLEDEDIARVKAMGVVEFFPKGTSYTELIRWSQENIKPSEFA